MDNYANHQVLKSIFPGEGKLLFQQQGSMLYVMTDLVIDSKYSDDFRIELLGDSFKYLNDTAFNFSIRLNAAKANKHKRYTIYPDMIEPFVDSKLSDIGAEIHNRVIMNEGVLASIRKGVSCCHSSVLVVGSLTIKDLDKFSKVLHTGIGKAKGFGFGMLNIFQ
jgi:hypothetical protein